MTMMLKTILLICGGVSAEHEISISSGKFIAENIDKTLYNVSIVIVGRDRCWYSIPYADFMAGNTVGPEVYLARHQGQAFLKRGAFSEKIDLAFPAIHGTSGEDGSLQGFLEYMGIPYVGNGVLASAVTMDKIATKQMLLACHLPVVPFFGVSSCDKIPDYATACAALETETLVIKPACSGSSVGVSKISCEQDYWEKVHEAFWYSQRILVEQAITGSEVECAILGNRDAIASGVGEIIPYTPDRMYSYKAKYHDPEHGQAKVCVQAESIDKNTQECIRTMALQAFHALTCSGLARVDFFVVEQNIFINEINALPGFTAISLYPQLWKQAGIAPKELIAQLIACAVERFESIALFSHMPKELQHPGVYLPA